MANEFGLLLHTHEVVGHLRLLYYADGLIIQIFTGHPRTGNRSHSFLYIETNTVGIIRLLR